jgi:hemoglobin
MCQNATPTVVVNPTAQHGCGCGGHGHAATANPPAAGRVVAAHHELEMPEVRFPSARVLTVAGSAGLRRLVSHHHALLQQSVIGHLFAADDAAFAALVERIADYIVEVCGGPALFTPAHGNTCMRTRHFPFTIDEAGREIWLEKLLRAMEETEFPEELHEEYWTWMEAFTIRMINRRTTKTQPVRLPYALARQRFAPAIAG